MSNTDTLLFNAFKDITEVQKGTLFKQVAYELYEKGYTKEEIENILNNSIQKAWNSTLDYMRHKLLHGEPTNEEVRGLRV